MASADLREELKCSICLSVYTDPVTMTCGHNFCLVCIGSLLDTQEGSGVYSCPECRAEFQERPALQRNMKLCKEVEGFLSAQPEEKTIIFCTYCIQAAVPAVKTCLQCETSLCDAHLTAHNKSVKHFLTEPTTSSEKRKCSIHKELLKYHCSEDAACICVSCCLAGEHKGHQVDLLSEASDKRKEKLRNILQKLASKREDTEKRVQSLQELRTEAIEKSAAVTERVTSLFRDIGEQLEALERQVLSEVSRQEEQVSLQVSGLIQQLEIMKDELSRKIRHIEELCNLTDALHFLQGWESDRPYDCDTEESSDEDKESDDKEVPDVSDLDEGLISVTLYRALANIVTDVKVKRGFYVQESSDILLDVNTAGPFVAVSGDLKTASKSDLNQCHRQTSERFIDYSQVLSTKSFSSGRHYWEVETSDSGQWDVGMSYPSIEREGDRSSIGHNQKSWCFGRYETSYLVIHNSIEQPFTPESSLQRFGIYLDYEAGRLSFYQLCDPVRHLHIFTATFTEPLHAAFFVYNNSWVRIRRDSPKPANVQSTSPYLGTLQIGPGDSAFQTELPGLWGQRLILQGMEFADLREELNCSICLNIYTDPVMLRCGHNFCRVCIGSLLDTQEGSGVYSCPECRAQFQERPALQRNMKLCNIMERVFSTPPKQEKTGIFCTYCVDSPVPAVKTCLHCETSLCDTHLTAHNNLVSHTVIEPITFLKSRKCTVHHNLLEYYCSEDGTCICGSCCVFGGHKGHPVEHLNEANEKKKVKLRNVLEKLTSKRTETEDRVHGLQNYAKDVQEKAIAVTERVSALFRDFRESLEALEKRVLIEISGWEEKVSLKISDLIQQLEVKTDELSRKIRHIEKLCNMADPVTVLKERESDKADFCDTKGVDDQSLKADDKMVRSIGKLDGDLISVTIHTALADIVTGGKVNKGFCVPEASNIFLDEDTAADNVAVSFDSKTASWTKYRQHRYGRRNKFASGQVLSMRSFYSGRHYWEVETSESGDWSVGVAYPSIPRQGELAFIGDNAKSWSLNMQTDGYFRRYSVSYDNDYTSICLDSSSQRFGIYLDFEAGRLSFYQLCDRIRHLHTFTATFNEPLHAAFYVQKSWVKIKSPTMASADLREELKCSICLNIYTDPVMLGCGHNFCQVCIGNVLDTQEVSEVYSCPECRAEFQERPALQRNMKLCNIVERVFSTPPKQEETEIFCTYCVDSSVPAVKTCLYCETSLCDIHLTAHNKSVKHIVTEPTTYLKNRKCSVHNKILEYYSPEDGACICVSCCVFGSHKGHQVEKLTEASEKKKEQLRNILEKLTSKREQTDKRVRGLQNKGKKVQKKAAELTERVTGLFKEIQENLEVLEKRVLSNISNQVEQVSLKVSERAQQLEIKKDELYCKMLHTEELCNMTDPLTLLQEWESDGAEFCDGKKSDNEEEADNKDTELDDQEDSAVGDLDGYLIAVTIHTALADIVTGAKSRRGFCVPVSSDISLDVNSAADNVAVSDELKTATWTDKEQHRYGATKKFDSCQVLSTTSFSAGRHYWEVETSESGDWGVGVAYSSIERGGNEAWIGNNNKSWSLDMYSENLCFKDYSAGHNLKYSTVHPESSCRRFVVCLDYEAGHLYFYQLCDPIRHLHTFTAIFTEPLHAAFYVNKSWVKIKSVK
ncbi:LOW QUALITY PROTEIN: uncharacterized protein WCC33_013274 [Rhinophrynus dorsalis]